MNRLKSILFTRVAKDRKQAFTLIEIAIVISIITLLALGIAQSASYFRTQANKSLCIVIQKQIQDAVRSIQNLNNLDYGSPFDTTQLWPDTGATSTTAFFSTLPVCPATGSSYNPTTGGIVPQPAVEYAPCTYTGHQPTSTQTAGW